MYSILPSICNLIGASHLRHCAEDDFLRYIISNKAIMTIITQELAALHSCYDDASRILYQNVRELGIMYLQDESERAV